MSRGTGGSARPQQHGQVPADVQRGRVPADAGHRGAVCRRNAAADPGHAARLAGVRRRTAGRAVELRAGARVSRTRAAGALCARPAAVQHQRQRQLEPLRRRHRRQQPRRDRRRLGRQLCRAGRASGPVERRGARQSDGDRSGADVSDHVRSVARSAGVTGGARQSLHEAGALASRRSADSATVAGRFRGRPDGECRRQRRPAHARCPVDLRRRRFEPRPRRDKNHWRQLSSWQRVRRRHIAGAGASAAVCHVVFRAHRADRARPVEALGVRRLRLPRFRRRPDRGTSCEHPAERQPVHVHRRAGIEPAAAVRQRARRLDACGPDGHRELASRSSRRIT